MMSGAWSVQLKMARSTVLRSGDAAKNANRRLL